MIIQPSLFLLRKPVWFRCSSFWYSEFFLGIDIFLLAGHEKGPVKKHSVWKSVKKSHFSIYFFRLIFGTKMEILIDALLFRNETFLVIFKQYEKGTQKGSKEISSDWRSAVDLKGNWEKARRRKKYILRERVKKIVYLTDIIQILLCWYYFCYNKV